MAEEKKQAPNVEEIKTVSDESLDEAEQQETPAGGFKPLIKKFLIPAVIGLAALLVSLAIPRFLQSDKKSQEEILAEPAVDSAVVETGNRDSLLQVAARPLEVDELDAEELEELLAMRNLFDQLDTAAILEEMAMMDGIHDELDIDSAPMSASDSVDTLNWMDREMEKIAAERDSLKLLKEEMQVLTNKVMQASNKLDQAEAARLTKLARLYDGMKPAEVANLFDNLSDSLIVLILPKMKPAHASKILGLMKPKRAASISTKLITVAEP